MTKQTELYEKTAFMEVVEGGRVRLEAETVEDLFLGRYDPAKVAGLARRGLYTSDGLPKPRKGRYSERFKNYGPCLRGFMAALLLR